MGREAGSPSNPTRSGREASSKTSCRTQVMGEAVVPPQAKTDTTQRTHSQCAKVFNCLTMADAVGDKCLSTWSNGLKPCNSCACRCGGWASRGANRRNAAEICRSNKRTGVRRSTHHDMCASPAWDRKRCAWSIPSHDVSYGTSRSPTAMLVWDFRTL